MKKEYPGMKAVKIEFNNEDIITASGCAQWVNHGVGSCQDTPEQISYNN